MIAHLSYVVCDRCLTPAQPAEDAEAARVEATATEGFTRYGGQDLCPVCNPCPITSGCGRGGGHKGRCARITNGGGARWWVSLTPAPEPGG